MATGTTLFTKVNLRSEPDGYGSAVPADVTDSARRMHVGPTGILTLGEEWDLGADRTVGVSNPVVQGAQTLVSKNPTISLEAPSVPTDELPYYLSMFREAAGTEALATTKRWTFRFGEPTVGDPISMAGIVSDGNVHVFANGIALETLELSASAAGLTSLSGSGFAKSCYPQGSAPTAAIPAITPRSIAGRVWQVKTWNEFPGSVEEGVGTAFEWVYDWALSMTSGNGPINSQAGSLLLSGLNVAAAPFAGTLSMTVASTPDTNTAFVDNRGGNIFLELSWADAGDPAHDVSIRLAGIISSVELLSGDQDGVATYAVEVALAYDPISEKTVEINVVNQADDLIGAPYLGD